MAKNAIAQCYIKLSFIAEIDCYFDEIIQISLKSEENTIRIFKNKWSILILKFFKLIVPKRKKLLRRKKRWWARRLRHSLYTPLSSQFLLLII